MNVHSRIHACYECEKSFCDSNSLKSHMKNHRSERSTKCLKCEKTFKSSTGFSDHNALKHTKENPFVCKICDKAFSRSGLTFHMMAHRGEKPHICDVCQKTFRKPDSLKNHMATHTEDRPFKCTQCDKTFKNSKSLTDHKIYHTRGKTLFCKLCNRAMSRTGIKYHMMEHKEEKPHVCVNCNKTFRKQQNLQNHMTVHTNERPFKCSQCQRSFKLSYNRKIHLQTHLKNFCKICSNKFKKLQHISNYKSKHTTFHMQEINKPIKCSFGRKHNVTLEEGELDVDLEEGEM